MPPNQTPDRVETRKAQQASIRDGFSGPSCRLIDSKMYSGKNRLCVGLIPRMTRSQLPALKTQRQKKGTTHIKAKG